MNKAFRNKIKGGHTIMELVWLLAIWVVSLYIIRLHLELYTYRKYFNQHNDIYVPSYQELIKNNHWSLRFLDLLLLQFKRRDRNASKLNAVSYKKKLVPGPLYIKE